MKILLITDTHLAPRAQAFNQNWQIMADWAAQADFDMAIHLGDISAAGSEHPQDLVFAAQILKKFPCSLHIIPGNHDLGDNNSQLSPHHEVITPDSLARYRQVFGPDYWSLHIEGWHLIGLNAQLFGDGGIDEQHMLEWLEQDLNRVHVNAMNIPQYPVGIFLHKPLFKQNRHEADSTDRYIPAQARQKLLMLLDNYDLRFVMSGHTHQYRHIEVDGVDHIWVPSTSFCIPDAVQEPIGKKVVGAMQLDLKPLAHTVSLLQVPDLQRYNLLEQTDVYPQLIGLKDRLGNAGEL